MIQISKLYREIIFEIGPNPVILGRRCGFIILFIFSGHDGAMLICTRMLNYLASFFSHRPEKKSTTQIRLGRSLQRTEINRADQVGEGITKD